MSNSASKPNLYISNPLGGNNGRYTTYPEKFSVIILIDTTSNTSSEAIKCLSNIIQAVKHGIIVTDLLTGSGTRHFPYIFGNILAGLVLFRQTIIYDTILLYLVTPKQLLTTRLSVDKHYMAHV